MTPKEKAKQLFETYFKIVDKIDNPNLEYYYYIQHAKECALTSVDEIMSIFEPISLRINSSSILFEYNEGVDQYHFWKKVKEEIEKL